MRKEFADYFSSHAASYALFRPHYPAAVAETVAKHAGAARMVVECGCGNGQLSVLLSEYFHEVIATDASAEQIQHAHLHPRVRYFTSRAECLPVADCSADAVVAAQAAHWFDLDHFYPEVRRVSKPDGVLALISYGSITLEGEIGQLVHQFEHDVLGSYWPPERALVEQGYRSLPFPFEEVAIPLSHIEAEWNYHQLVGYILTWSSVRALEAAGRDALMTDFATQLRQGWGDVSLTRKARWPLSMRLGYVR